MVENQLISLTVDFLKVMIALYEQHNIDNDIFHETCILKVQFLEKIISDFPLFMNLEEVKLIIDKCKAVIGVSI